tara:strand:+ start:315 stop:506 length:192 start_codon:yes stop_codon:yes gene_type:complete
VNEQWDEYILKVNLKGHREALVFFPLGIPGDGPNIFFGLGQIKQSVFNEFAIGDHLVLFAELN